MQFPIVVNWFPIITYFSQQVSKNNTNLKKLIITAAGSQRIEVAKHAEEGV